MIVALAVVSLLLVLFITSHVWPFDILRPLLSVALALFVTAVIRLVERTVARESQK